MEVFPMEANSPFGETATVIAWSSDGGRALVEDLFASPEDGQRKSYHLYQGGKDRQEFVIFDNCNPGDGSLPQRVSPELRAARIGELRTALKTLGFPDLTFSPEGEASPEFQKSPRVPWIGARADVGLRSITLEPKGKDVQISEGGKAIGQCPAKYIDWSNHLRAVLSPNGRLLLVFEDSEHRHPLKAVWYATNGRDFVPALQGLTQRSTTEQ
jgi:hypothetical protein